MNILYISTGDNGGASYWLADAINKYTNHHARSIRMVQSYINYPYDMLNPPDADIMKWANWADVIHVRDGAPSCIDSIKGKRHFITFTGMSYRKKAALLVNHYRKLGYTVCVSTADLLAYHPTNPPVWSPNPRETMEPSKQFDQFTVCHAPTYRERKGTETVIEACRAANIRLELLEHTTYTEVMNVKSRCHLVICQFAYGYGNNAIEAWALGLPVISCGAKQLLQEIGKQFGGRLPFARCPQDAGALSELITSLKNNKKVYEEWCSIGKRYFLTHHHAPVVAEKLIKLYS